MAGRCRYWILIKKYKRKIKPYIHEMRYERYWTTGGWSSIPNYKTTIQKRGSFETRSQMLSYYWDNQANLPGGADARIVDMSEHPATCEDQA